MGSPHSPVRKRTVFYFCGFDPRGPAQYHALYRTEGEKQSALNGLELSVGDRKRNSPLASLWDITAKTSDGTTIEIRYEFLRWDDIVRRHWPKGEFAMLRGALRSYWTFLTSGLLGKFYRTSWPPALTLTYPFLILLAILAGGLGLGVAAGAAICALLNWPWWAGLIPGATVWAGSIAFGRWLDGRLHAYWLVRTYTFMQRWLRGGVPELDERLHQFAGYIAEHLQNTDDDEVLIIGHSVGTVLIIPLVEKILENNPQAGTGETRIGLITLGNCIPLISFHSFAQPFRDQLATVALAPGIDWVDFSARRDGASFAGIDTVATSGIGRPVGAAVRPKLVPAAFFRMFSPESYNRIKRDIFRIHFQYLMAGEMLTDYDYFAITAGPLSLRERFDDVN